MYIIDQIEHGNCGVMNIKVLDRLPLKEALKKTPQDYGVRWKMWGFWPVISITKDSNDFSYQWIVDEDERGAWVKSDRKKTKRKKKCA